jgi:hypothetical protein
MPTRTCTDCGAGRDDVPSGPCSQCGALNITLAIPAASMSMTAGHISWTGVRRYVERHPVWFPVSIALAVGSPFLGLAVVGWPGVVVGLALAGVGIWIGDRTVTRYQETTHSG